MANRYFILILFTISFSLVARCQKQELINFKLDSVCTPNSINTFHANGKIMGCGQAIKTGKWCYWDEGGKLEAIRYFSASNEDSLLVTFLESGIIRSISISENNRKKYWTIFDSASNMREFYNYFNDSLVQIISFRANGSIESILLQTNGICNDFWGAKMMEIVEFNEVGIITKRKIYIPPRSNPEEW